MRFKESEHEKINKELLNKLVPMDVLNSYYIFGYADALVNLKKVTGLMDNRYSDVQKFINEYIESATDQNEEIKTYYDRLSKK